MQNAVIALVYFAELLIVTPCISDRSGNPPMNWPQRRAKKDCSGYEPGLEATPGKN